MGTMKLSVTHPLGSLQEGNGDRGNQIPVEEVDFNRVKKICPYLESMERLARLS